MPVPAAAAFDLFFGGSILPWRHFEECSYIRVLEDDGDGRQLLEAEETVEFAFLHLHKTLRTRLLVTLDRPAGTMAFRLAERGVLRRFEGQWRLVATGPSSCELLIMQEVQPKWAPRPLRRRMRYALLAFCEFMLREMRDEAARVAAGRPAAGPRACDGIRAAEAEAVVAVAS
ncbi:hypothetical protein WJX81_005072 [Elliptochloris bilobata]|uniref:Coenzyme Q-binding protein COQ10 START domain-containing protein n=1 Tax=Elliptochloris bilobata TaxID=381761 RepID=A0AAW1RUY2_9CHLO